MILYFTVVEFNKKLYSQISLLSYYSRIKKLHVNLGMFP